MSIYIYTGKTGSGKTYCMVKDAYKRWLKGQNIYSNTFLFFDEVYKKSLRFFWRKLLRFIFHIDLKCGEISYYEDIVDLFNVRDGLILLDEGQVLLNARSWDSLPRIMSYKLQQHRKHNLDLFATSQSMGCIDKDYRRLIQYWFDCKKFLQLKRFRKVSIIYGIFLKYVKDVDAIWETQNEAKLVENIGWPKLFTIHFLKRRLYDTSYDIGFNYLKIIWVSKLKIMIISKEMSLSKALNMKSYIQRASK